MEEGIGVSVAGATIPVMTILVLHFRKNEKQICASLKPDSTK